MQKQQYKIRMQWADAEVLRNVWNVFLDYLYEAYLVKDILSRRNIYIEQAYI